MKTHLIFFFALFTVSLAQAQSKQKGPEKKAQTAFTKAEEPEPPKVEKITPEPGKEVVAEGWSAPETSGGKGGGGHFVNSGDGVRRCVPGGHLFGRTGRGLADGGRTVYG